MINPKNITEIDKLVLNGMVCPYCLVKTINAHDTLVYDKSYGSRVQVCVKCKSYVGCDSKNKPLGRLANKELRKLKIMAHHHFDKIWRKSYMKRSEAYAWLSEELGIPKKFTHIGMFGEKTCIFVIELSKSKLKELKCTE